MLQDTLAISQYEYCNIIEVCSYLNYIYTNYQKNHLPRNVKGEKKPSTSSSKPDVNTKPVVTCHYCRKPGHLKVECCKYKCD